MQVRQFSTTDDAYTCSLNLREEYLRKPLGLSLKDEDLTIETEQLHFGLFDGNKLLGSVTFKIISKTTLKLRQMVIDQNYKGAGLGSKLILQAESIVKEMGYIDIEMAARIYAKNFYEKMGYKCVGDIFIEVGIDHIKMVKRI